MTSVFQSLSGGTEECEEHREFLGSEIIPYDTIFLAITNHYTFFQIYRMFNTKIEH